MWPFNWIRKMEPGDNAKANALLLRLATAAPSESEAALKRIQDRLHEEFTLPQISRTLANRADADDREDTILDIYTVVQVEVNKRVDLMRAAWLTEYVASGEDSALANRRARQNPLWIQDFLATVGTASNRAWAKRLARQNPVWTKLRSDLESVLQADSALAVWPCPAVKKNTGGLRDWKGQPARMTALLGLVKADPLTYYRAEIQPAVPDATQISPLVTAIFRSVKCPFLLNYLATIVQGIQGVREMELGSLAIRTADGSELSIEIGDSSPTPDQQEMLRAYYRLSWQLLGELGSRQKADAPAPQTPVISLQRRVIALQALSSDAPMGDCLLDSVEIEKIAASLGIEINGLGEIWSAQKLARELRQDWESFATLLTRLPIDDESDDSLMRRARSRWSKGHLDEIGADSLAQIEALLGFPKREFATILLRLPFDDAEIAAVCGSSVSSVREARSMGRLRLRAMLQERYGISVDLEMGNAANHKESAASPLATTVGQSEPRERTQAQWRR